MHQYKRNSHKLIMLIMPLRACICCIAAPLATAASQSIAAAAAPATAALNTARTTTATATNSTDSSGVSPIGPPRLALSPQPGSKLLSNGYPTAFNGSFSPVLQLQPVAEGDERRASASSTGSSSGSSRRFAFGQQQQQHDDSFAGAAAGTAAAAADSVGERDSVMSSNDDLVSFLEQTGSILALAQVRSFENFLILCLLSPLVLLHLRAHLPLYT
jgi:hypothetical protein